MAGRDTTLPRSTRHVQKKTRSDINAHQKHTIIYTNEHCNVLNDNYSFEQRQFVYLKDGFSKMSNKITKRFVVANATQLKQDLALFKLDPYHIKAIFRQLNEQEGKLIFCFDHDMDIAMDYPKPTEDQKENIRPRESCIFCYDKISCMFHPYPIKS